MPFKYLLTCHSKVSDIDTKNNIGHDVIGKSLRTKHMMSVIDCEDPNGNTPLSEAASRFALIFLLIMKYGIDYNSDIKILIYFILC